MTEVTLDVTQLAVEASIPIKSLRLSEQHNAQYRAKTFQMMLSALTKPYESISYPADWWQSFKLRWLPRWAKDRWPVRMEMQQFARYCPHIDVPDNEWHVKFVLGDEPNLHTTTEYEAL